jgi:hypothetical protein
MRVTHVLLGVALATCAVSATAAPKRAAPAAQKKKPPPKSPKAEPSTETAPTPADAAAEAAPPPAPSASAEAAPSATDAKLDEPPPPATDAKSDGKKASPLTPEASEMPGQTAPPGPSGLDQLMADIATLRARVAALTTSLFSSKLRVSVETEGDDARILAFVITLDDGVVFRADPGFIADQQKVVYEHAVAPGSHVLGIEIERQDSRGTAYRTWQTTRAAINVPERKTLDATLVLEDDSDMGADFPSDQDGEYELAVSVRAKVAD